MSDEDCPAFIDRENSSSDYDDDSSDEDSYSGGSSAEDSVPGLFPRNNRRGTLASNVNENQNWYNHPPIPQAQFQPNEVGSEGDSTTGSGGHDDSSSYDDTSSYSSSSMPNLLNRRLESSDDSESSEDDNSPRRRNDSSDSSDDDGMPNLHLQRQNSSSDDSSDSSDDDGMPNFNLHHLQRQNSSSDDSDSSSSIPVARLQRVRRPPSTNNMPNVVAMQQQRNRNSHPVIPNPSSRREEDQQDYRRGSLASLREEALIGLHRQNSMILDTPMPNLNYYFEDRQDYRRESLASLREALIGLHRQDLMIPEPPRLNLNFYFDDSTCSASSIDSDFDVEVEPLIDNELEFRKMVIHMMIDNDFWGNVGLLIDDLKKGCLKEVDSFEAAVKTWKGRQQLVETLQNMMRRNRVLDYEKHKEKREKDIFNFVTCYEETIKEIDSLDVDSDDCNKHDEEDNDELLLSSEIRFSSSGGCENLFIENEERARLYEERMRLEKERARIQDPICSDSIVPAEKSSKRLIENLRLDEHCEKPSNQRLAFLRERLENIVLLQRKKELDSVVQIESLSYRQMVSKVILRWVFERNDEARITHLMKIFLQTKWQVHRRYLSHFQFFEHNIKEEIIQNLQVLESYLSRQVIQNRVILTIGEMV